MAEDIDNRFYPRKEELKMEEMYKTTPDYDNNLTTVINTYVVISKDLDVYVDGKLFARYTNGKLRNEMKNLDKVYVKSYTISKIVNCADNSEKSKLDIHTCSTSDLIFI